MDTEWKFVLDPEDETPFLAHTICGDIYVKHWLGFEDLTKNVCWKCEKQPPKHLILQLRILLGY